MGKAENLILKIQQMSAEDKRINVEKICEQQSVLSNFASLYSMAAALFENQNKYYAEEFLKRAESLGIDTDELI